MKPHDLRIDIGDVLNRYSAENGSNTPDYILADYLLACLAAYDAAVTKRAAWHGHAPLVTRDVPSPEGTPS